MEILHLRPDIEDRADPRHAFLYPQPNMKDIALVADELRCENGFVDRWIVHICIRNIQNLMNGDAWDESSPRPVMDEAAGNADDAIASPRTGDHPTGA